MEIHFLGAGVVSGLYEPMSLGIEAQSSSNFLVDIAIKLGFDYNGIGHPEEEKSYRVTVAMDASDPTAVSAIYIGGWRDMLRDVDYAGGRKEGRWEKAENILLHVINMRGIRREIVSGGRAS